jgi:NAD(P)H-dependent flavin oxidoreductase YrpB (nitropropane dioxygenase family)
VNEGMVTFGMCGGLIEDVPTCKDVIQNIVSEAESIIKERLNAMFAA